MLRQGLCIREAERAAEVGRESNFGDMILDENDDTPCFCGSLSSMTPSP